LQKNLAIALDTTGLIGADIGIARNFSLISQLFGYAILGFAFFEATGLLALLVAFLLLYVVKKIK
jgi:F-type H+-transporting ATPase subunit c